MATGFTLVGFSARYGINDQVIAVVPTTFQAVYPDARAFFGYNVISSFPNQVPQIDFTGPSPIRATLNDIPIDVNTEQALGYIDTAAGRHIILAFFDYTTNTDHIFQIGGVPLALPTTVAQFTALDAQVFGAGVATGAFKPGVNIPLSSLPGVQIEDLPNFVSTITGADGGADLFGTDIDDMIITGDGTGNGDFVAGSLGNDTIDMGRIDLTNGYVRIDYIPLSGPVQVTLNGATNTGSVAKGAAGTDTLIDVSNPLDFGWFYGGLSLGGTNGNDSFNVTLDNEQWISLEGGAGTDSYTLNGTGLLELDFRNSNSGITINLANRQVLNDGFGNSETIGGSASVHEVQGSLANDSFVGSAADDSYLFLGGNNTIDGGAGNDRVRYDDSSIDVVDVDLSAGRATVWMTQGNSFTDSLSNIEQVRGSNGYDRMVAAASGSELDGLNGDDTLLGGAGRDGLWGQDGQDYINPGDNADYDAIETGAGFDRVDFANAQNGYFSLEHWSIRTQTAIDVMINSATNTGSVDKGFLGLTALLDVTKAMQADGLGIAGTDLGDMFTVYVGGGDYLQIQAGRGGDQFVIDGTGNGVGYVQLRFDRDGDFQTATQGLVINLATGIVANDGFGSQDSLTFGPNAVETQVMGTNLADDMTGSARDDSFLSLGGNDTIRGGDGFDVVSYNRNEAGAMRIDLAAGTARGTHDGLAFTDTLSSIEGALGSRFGNDVIKGSSVANFLAGCGGNDALYGDGYRAGYALDDARAVYRLYQATLDRVPDAVGHAGWTEILDSGANTLTGVAAGFVGSREFQTVYGALNNTDFVELLYQNVLGRAADAGGLAAWTNALAGGMARAQVVLGFSESAEFGKAVNPAATEFTRGRDAAVWQDDVFRLYQATLGRDPDIGGFKGWMGNLSTGMPFLTAVAGFVSSREFQNAYGALDNTGFVTLLYQNVLNRAPDAGGLTGWLDALAGGTTRAEVVRGFSQSREFIATTAPELKTWIRAQGEDDVFEGGAGTNDLWGGAMADVFLFDGADAGSHRIHDFEAWDYLEFQDFGYAAATQIRAHMTQQGADVVFMDQGTTVTLENTQLASLSNDMFVF